MVSASISKVNYPLNIWKHVGVLSIVATEALVPMPQTISINSADWRYVLLHLIYIKI